MIPERKIRLAAVLCYLPFASVVTGLATLLRFPHDMFALFHARQAFALFVVWFASFLLFTLSMWLGLFFWLILFIFSVYTSYSAWLGQQKPLFYLDRISRLIPVGSIYSLLSGRDFPSRHF